MKSYNRALMRASLLALAVLLLRPGLVSAQGAMAVEFYHLDAQGNVLAVTDATGAVVEWHDYDVFGQEVTPQPGTQPRRFTGKERDTETGWDYFGARYYGSRIGRFTTTDPAYAIQENLLDPQRWNKYAYARNNPLRFVDPDGRRVKVAVAPGVYRRNQWVRTQIDRLVSLDPGLMGPLDRLAVSMLKGMFPTNGAEMGQALVGTAFGMVAPLEGAAFAQRTFSEEFSLGGNFAGKTVDDVATALRAGDLKPADVPIDYIVRDGTILILNTRSAQALDRAGVPRSAWTATDRTGQAAYEARLSGQLRQNDLSNSGTPTVESTRKPKQ